MARRQLHLITPSTSIIFSLKCPFTSGIPPFHREIPVLRAGATRVGSGVPARQRGTRKPALCKTRPFTGLTLLTSTRLVHYVSQECLIMPSYAQQKGAVPST